jgi:hypothetical protein
LNVVKRGNTLLEEDEDLGVYDGQSEERHQILDDEDDDGERGVEAFRESFDADLEQCC